ncbi:TerB family tellurite resistance protein [Magnetospirillum sp. UT-4]|uniref:tellurite resistance TerB family protein n=1 Tax=Magnetospirillum sp. UT-4 TaxID=2681467 RepID=UPI00137D3C81|nr:TerB family tellurite resistance protein [Magnetospirillum sp. UT-4]CAA7624003.1 conserved hypothetical protein [Magnetospirillum sp. UT-4]
MKHLEILATALAYACVIDGKVSVEEKAKLAAILGKHVARNELSQTDLQETIQAAFATARGTHLDKFLPEVLGRFSTGQQASLLLNLYDIVLADGTLAEGERWLLDKFENALAFDRATLRAARKVVMCKNDTSVFTNPTHPANESGYAFKVE